MDAFEAISLPDAAAASERKVFSVAKANQALTLVRRIVTDIVREYRRLQELHHRCEQLDQGGAPAEAEAAREEYAAVTDRLSELRDELQEIGCELKDYALGLVDFPAIRDQREILLCWKLGEERIGFWHEPDRGFPSRRPIPEDWE